MAVLFSVIWKERNRRIFSDKRLEIVEIFGLGLFLWPLYRFQYLKSFQVFLSSLLGITGMQK